MEAHPRNRAGFLTLKTMLKPPVKLDAKKPKSKVATWVVGASGLIAVLALVILWWLSESDEPSAPTATPRKHSLAETNTNTTAGVRTNAVRKAPLGYEDGVEILSLSARTNTAGAVIEKLRLADGTIICAPLRMRLQYHLMRYVKQCRSYYLIAVRREDYQLPGTIKVQSANTVSFLSP